MPRIPTTLNPTEPPTLFDALNDLDLNRVASIAGVHPRTLRNMAQGEGESDPKWSTVKAVFNAAPTGGQSTIIAALVAGTRWVGHLQPETLDLDGDGDVTTDDAMLATIEATEKLAAQMRDLHRASADRAVTPAEAATLYADIDATIGDLLAVKAVVTLLEELGSKRRKCKSLTTTLPYGGSR